MKKERDLATKEAASEMYQFLLQKIRFESLVYKMSAAFHLDYQLVEDLVWDIIADMSMSADFMVLENKLSFVDASGTVQKVIDIHGFVKKSLKHRVLDKYFKRKIDKHTMVVSDIEVLEANRDLFLLIAQAHEEFLIQVLPNRRAWFLKSILNIDGGLSVQQLLAEKGKQNQTNMGLFLLLHFVKELDHKEIAEAFSIPVNTVKTRILRGKEHCHKEFALYYYLYTTPTGVVDALMEQAVIDLGVRNDNGAYLMVYKLYRQGNSLTEIAKIIKKKEETVAPILTRIHNMLDKLLDEKAREVVAKLSIQEIIEFFI